MTRILHVYRTYFPETQGGLEEAIRQICRSTTALGCENRVFTLGRSPEASVICFPEAEVHRFPSSGEIASCGFSLQAVAGFKKLSQWADLIHYHFPWPFADLLHLLAQPGKPTCITYHSDIVRQKWLRALYYPLQCYFLGQADRIVATSRNYLESSQVLAGYRRKVEVIPLGLARESYPAPAPADLAAMKERVGENFFLFIGVLRYYKGLPFLLAAVQESGLRVVIAGSGPDGERLRDEAARLGLETVVFLGQVSDQEKVALLTLAKAVVFPSSARSEAFGVTLLEAAMHGKPMISTEIGTGTSYVNAHGETGLVVAPANPGQLRAAMERLTREEATVQRMGEAAKARYERLFTATLLGERYVALYGKLAKGDEWRVASSSPPAAALNI